VFTWLAALLLVVTCGSSGAGEVQGAPAWGQQEGTPGRHLALPVGSPTTVPWWQHRRLHIGDTVIRTRRSAIASRVGTTVVATSEDRRMGQPAIWYLVAGKRLQRLPMLTRADTPLISANGHWLAWLEVRAPDTTAYRRIERYRVVVYNVARHRITNRFRDRRLVEWEDGINGIWLRTLSNTGRLVLSRGSDGVKVLPPHGRLVRFGGPQVGNSAQVDGWPRGTTVFRSGATRSVYGRVSRLGQFDQVGEFTVSFSGIWSADGSAYAYTDYDTPSPTYWVRPLAGPSLQLDVPTDVPGYRIVGWESPDAVLLWYFNDYSSQPASRLLRCSTSVGSCERVPHGPRAGAPATMPSR